MYIYNFLLSTSQLRVVYSRQWSCVSALSFLAEFSIKVHILNILDFANPVVSIHLPTIVAWKQPLKYVKVGA